MSRFEEQKLNSGLDHTSCTQKKWATEVAQNALRARCEKLQLSVLRVFPEEEAHADEEQGQHAGADVGHGYDGLWVVQKKHGGLLRLLLFDGVRLIPGVRAGIDLDQ